MPQYCLVKHRISTYVIDGADSDRNPDRIPVTGTVTFEALLDKGDSVVVTEDGEVTTITLAPIEALITNGEIYHRGEEGVKLFAGGPDSNPEKIRYKATFHNLIAGGKKIELKPILFEAVPGGELALSMTQPVPGKPYPGYSATIEQGITLIEGARDEALGQVEGAVDEAIGTRLDAKADVSTVNDLTAVTNGFAGVARRNSRRIRELVSELAGKADKTGVETALATKADKTTVDAALAAKADQAGVDAALATKADTDTVDELSILMVGALGVGRRNTNRIRQLVTDLATKADQAAVADLSALTTSAVGMGKRNATRIRQLVAALAGKADQSALTAGLAQKADTSTLDARIPAGGHSGQLLMATPTGGRWSWADRHPAQYHDIY